MKRQSSRTIWIPGGIAVNDHITPPTVEQTRPTSSEDQTLPLPPTDYQVYDTDEHGELVAKSSPYAPKLTYEEEKRQRQARHQDYKAAVPHKDKLTCRECDTVIEGKVAFKHHLKDVHDWSKARIRKYLDLTHVRKQFSCPIASCTKK